jgi:hypothetical protein
VKADEKPPEPEQPARPMTLSEAIESGSYLEILRAQRRQVVEDIPKSSAAPLAALHRTLRELSKEIAHLEEIERQEGSEDAEAAAAAGVADEPWDAASL